MDKVIYNVSSYNRKETLIKTIESVYNQCDIINVALNNYNEIPIELYDKKINLFITNNEKGDAYKFYNLLNSDGYFFTIDDDLIYPKNYTEYMISKVEEYKRNHIITLHGRNFRTFPIKSYYDGKITEVLHFRQPLNQDRKVQFGGTGVMAFHTDLFKVSIDYFEYPNMADVWIGKFAKENGINITCVKHNDTFVRQQEFKESIYSTDLKNDIIQTKIVNQTYGVKDLSIIIPTFKNVEYIDECINSLINSSKNHNVEILVGIDNCNETLKHIVKQKYKENIKFYYFYKNEGPYLIKNTLASFSNSNYILFFDSDDVALNTMVPTVMLNKKNYKMVKPKFKNFGNKSHDGKEIAFGEGVFAIDKQVFLSMNGFEPWMCAADSDFMGRFYKKNERSILHTHDIMFNRRIHDKGLTSREETGLGSKLRKEYIRLSKEKKHGTDPQILNVRKFKQIFINNFDDNDKDIKELLFDKKLEITRIGEENTKKNKVLNTISHLNLKPNSDSNNKKPTKSIDYEKINNIINQQGVFNPKDHTKETIKEVVKTPPIQLAKDSINKLKKEMFAQKPKKKGVNPNIFGNNQRRKGGFSI
jgi:glycosyltransferase involved in cell wall biosynthesis